MTDPRRLVTGSDEPADLGSSELTRWLITSARSEEPGAHALQRALVGVGATGAVLAATASASAGSSSAASVGAASSGAGVGASAVATGASAVGSGALASKAGAGLVGAVGKAAVLKWVAVSVIGGATLVGAGSKLLAPKQSTAPTSQSAIRPSENSAPVISAPISEAANKQQPESQLAPPAVTPLTTAHPAATTTAVGRTTPVAESDDPEVMEATALAKEVQLIDQAREAKAAGQHAQVVTLTQRYLSSFPKGRLLPEAVFLKMESESALGRSQQAAQSAKLLLRVAPNSPQAARARELSAPSAP